MGEIDEIDGECVRRQAIGDEAGGQPRRVAETLVGTMFEPVVETPVEEDSI